MDSDNVSGHPRIYGPVATVLLTVGVFLVAQIVSGLLLSIIPIARGWDEARVTEWLENDVLAIASYLMLSAIVTVWMLSVLLKRRGASLRTLGLNKLQVKYVGYALGGFAVYFLLFIVGRILAKAIAPGLDVDQEQDIGFKPGIRGPGLGLVFACLVILPPLTEEIVMRGFLYGGLRGRLSVPVATLITSLIFGLAHLGGAKEGVIWIAALDTFILSLVLCHLREKTGSLWPPIGVHMIKNALAFTVLFIVSR